ncbi:MAG TPA: hypothetical protein VK023_05650 [Sphingobacterium bovisgrunnientis]|jgi:hypothetical protein|nr:hypothetical protein [Sphingobacterium bovisgrunnientis]
MISKYVLFIVIFVIGEILINITWFKYLKRKFTGEYPEEKTSNKETQDSTKRLLGLNISTFKGIMERLIMATSLAIGVTPILIVFGALKIGTRLKSPDDKIQNDYFLIGNLSSIFISVIYVYIFEKTIHLLHML